ncbi:hypothetical protein MUN82_08660 [Hymenobacter aerilatus]|uniref:Uncharacterized protein n=1 Tax=Hymenobacter aerilatus TaxID=2932251 RepID=A0A8T9T1V2_9BACT|nr:hypothetical protein [Hymenobacter aerilatus]UOR07154.1 hypothetical protein MUN82_08660 [Hymenobacter aerilatus]
MATRTPVINTNLVLEPWGGGGGLTVAFQRTSPAIASEGQQVAWTSTASGGTAPYTHIITAKNTNTQVVQTIGGPTQGATYTGFTTALAAGGYELRSTVTDAAGTQKISPVRNVTVQAVVTGPQGIAANFPTDALVYYSFDPVPEKFRMFAGNLGSMRHIPEATYTAGAEMDGRSLRDPYVVERNGVQRMVHTRLIRDPNSTYHEYYNNSPTVALATATNGKDFTFLKLLTVSDNPKATTWSPKIITISGQDYIICAISTVDNPNQDNNVNMLFKPVVIPVSGLFSDNPTTGTPIEITGSAIPENIIDPHIVLRNGVYHLFFKDEITKYLVRVTSSSPFSGYNTGTGNLTALGQGLEGNSIYQFNGRDLLIYDKYQTNEGVAYRGVDSSVSAFGGYTQEFLLSVGTNGVLPRHGSLVAAGRPELIEVPYLPPANSTAVARATFVGANETTENVQLTLRGLLSAAVAESTTYSMQFYDSGIAGGSTFQDANKDGGVYTFVVPAGATSATGFANSLKRKRGAAFTVGWRLVSVSNASVTLSTTLADVQGEYLVSQNGAMGSGPVTSQPPGTTGATTGMRWSGHDEDDTKTLVDVSVLTTPAYAQAYSLQVQFYDSGIAGGSTFQDANKDGGVVTVSVPANTSSFVLYANVVKNKRAVSYEAGWKIISVSDSAVKVDAVTGQGAFTVGPSGGSSANLPVVNVTGYKDAPANGKQVVHLTYTVDKPFAQDTTIYIQVTDSQNTNQYPEQAEPDADLLVFPAGVTTFSNTGTYPQLATPYNFVLKLRTSAAYRFGAQDNVLLVIDPL